MFLFKRKGETVDNGPKDFQKFCYAVESFGFVYELEKHIVNGPTDI